MIDQEPVEWVAVATSHDRLGNDTSTPAGPVTLSALVADAGSRESDDPQDPQVTITKKLYFVGVTSVPSASDRITVRGEVYDVEGEPHRWGAEGVELTVSRTERRP